MPIYMDLHIVPGVTAQQVAEAHLLDVKIQDAFCCKAMTYWLDEDKGCVFCLIEAPDKESVREMHEKAHGLIPHEIISVNSEVVKAFLGRIQDPEYAIQHTDTKLKVFSDPAFRIILIAKALDLRLLQHAVGKERAHELLLLYSTIVRDQSKHYNGSEVFQREEGFVMSFANPAEALPCALAIQQKLQTTASLIGLRIALHGGVPVGKDDAIFGNTIRLAQFLCALGKDGQIQVSSTVRRLFQDNDWSVSMRQHNARCLTAAEESFLETLLHALSDSWQDPEFDLLDFSETMSVSKSQLYRKCMAITGMSPNILLREYRLLNALDLLRKEDRNISQTTFDTGFGSPSYFTKCFQKRFGLQPLTYLKSAR